MSITPLEFLETAIDMRLKNSGEVWVRNATSRAYYSIYSRSKELNITFPKNIKGSHAKVIAALVSHPNKDYRFIGHKLKECRSLRTSADYELNASFPEEKADMCIETAKRTHERINLIKSS